MGNKFFSISEAEIISAGSNSFSYYYSVGEIIKVIDEEILFDQNDIFNMIRVRTEKKYGKENVEYSETTDSKGNKENIVKIKKAG